MKVKEIGVSISKKLDVGFIPYKKYLEELSGRPAPYGSRNNSNTELTFWQKAEIEEGEDADQALQAMAQGLNTLIDELLKGVYPEAFDEETPQDQYLFDSAKTMAQDGEW